MRVFFSPQVNDNEKIKYSFNGEIITVEYKNQIDEFDFSGLLDGELIGVETILPIEVIISAKRVDGELFVELLNYISENATHEELFPEWIEV